MENQSQNSPLRSLIEVIVQKRSISSEEQLALNALALSGEPINRDDFDAIGKLTEMICAGEIEVAE